MSLVNINNEGVIRNMPLSQFSALFRSIGEGQAFLLLELQIGFYKVT